METKAKTTGLTRNAKAFIVLLAVIAAAFIAVVSITDAGDEVGEFVDGSITYYTDSQDAGFTVSFDSNGGTGSIKSVPVAKDTKFLLPICTFTAPEGMSFYKWTVGGNEYIPGDQITVDRERVVQAVWHEVIGSQVEYIVSFTSEEYPNAVKNEGFRIMSTSTFKLPNCEIDGDYYFVKWTIGTTDYQPGDTAEFGINEVSGISTNVTVKAVLEPIGQDASQYKTITVKETAEAEGVKTVIKTGSSYVVPNNPYGKGGYLFEHWDGNVQPGDRLTNVQADVTLLPSWTSDQGVKPIDADGNVVTSASISSVTISSYGGIKSTEYNPEFWSGWGEVPYDVYNWQGPSDSVTWDMGEQSVTITLQGLAKDRKYRIPIDGNLGINEVTLDNCVVYSEGAKAWRYDSSNDVTYFEIKGSSSGGTASIQYTVDPTFNFNVNKVFGGWKERTYQVTFSDGSNPANDVVVTAVAYYELSLPFCSFSKADYKFAGWSVDSDGDGVNEIKYPGDKIRVTKSMEIIPTWDQSGNLVTFKKDSTDLFAPMYVADNYMLTLPENIVPKGSGFECWVVDGENKQPGEKVKVTDSLDITAVWNNSPTNYTVKLYDGTPSGGARQTDSVVKGNGYLLPPCNYDIDYHKSFRIWAIQNMAGDISYHYPGEIISIDSDTTIVATWCDSVIYPGEVVDWSVTELEAIWLTPDLYVLKAFTLPSDGWQQLSGESIWVPSDYNKSRVAAAAVHPYRLLDTYDIFKDHLEIVDDNYHIKLSGEGSRMFTSINYFNNYGGNDTFYKLRASTDLIDGTYRTMDPYKNKNVGNSTRTESNLKAVISIQTDVEIKGDVIIDNVNMYGSTDGKHGDGKNGLHGNGHRLILGTGITNPKYEANNLTGLVDASDVTKSNLAQVFGGSNNTVTSSYLAAQDSSFEPMRMVFARDDSSMEQMVKIGSFVIIHSGIYSNVVGGGVRSANIGAEGDYLSTYLVMKGCIVTDTVIGGGGSPGSNGNVYGAAADVLSRENGGAFTYATGLFTLGDYWQDKTTGYDTYRTGYGGVGGNDRSHIYTTESSVFEGGCSKGSVFGAAHTFISGRSSVWDVQAGGRNYQTFVDYSYLEITGVSEVRRLACGTITDGNFTNSSTNTARCANVYVGGDATVASVYGAGFDTWSYPYSKSLMDGKVLVEIAGGTIYDVYGGGYRGSIGTKTQLDALTVEINMTGGTVLGNVYGGGSGGLNKMKHDIEGRGFQTDRGKDGNQMSTGRSYVYGNINVLISGGTINGNVYGGGMSVPILSYYNGVYEAYDYGNKAVSGDPKGDAGSNYFKTNESDGYGAQAEVATVQGDIAVVISGDAEINGSVFGAGKGIVLTSDGIVDKSEYGFNRALFSDGDIGKLYWTAEGAEGNYDYVNYPASNSRYDNYAKSIGTDALVIQNNSVPLREPVYGGGGFSKVEGSTIVYLISGKVNNDVFGGGLGTEGKLSVNGQRLVYLEGDSVVDGSIYGGSREGNDGIRTSDDQYHVDEKDGKVVVSSGTITGSIFGGGLKGYSYSNTEVYVGYYFPTLGNAHPVVNVPSEQTKVINVNSIFAGGSIVTATVGEDNVEAYQYPLVLGTGTVKVNGSNSITSITGCVMGSGNSCLTNGTKTIEISNIANTSVLTGIHRADKVTLENTSLRITGRSPITPVAGQIKPLSIYSVDELVIKDNCSIVIDSQMDDVKSISSQYANGGSTTSSSPQNRIVFSSGTTIYIRDVVDEKDSSGKYTGKYTIDYGPIKGYLMMTVLNQQSYGAYAIGKLSLDGGFSVINDGIVTETETSVSDNVCCWFISGIQKKVMTMELQYDNDRTVSTESHVEITKFQTDTSLMYTGGVFTRMSHSSDGYPYNFVKPSEFYENSEDLSLALAYVNETGNDRPTVYDPTKRSMYLQGRDMPVQGTYYSSSTVDTVSNELRDGKPTSLISIPMEYALNSGLKNGNFIINMTLSGAPEDATSYVGYLTLNFQEVKVVSYSSGSDSDDLRYLVSNTIEVRIDIYIYGNAGTESNNKFSVEVTTDRDQEGQRSGEASTLIPKQYQMAATNVVDVSVAGNLDITLSKDYSGNYVLPNCEYEAPIDYAFYKWSVKIGSGDPAEMAPGEILDIDTEVNGNVTITPIWKKDDAETQASEIYTIVLESNNSSNKTKTLVLYHDSQYILPNSSFKAIGGDKFTGWYVNDVATLRSPGYAITIGPSLVGADGKIHIAAQWGSSETIHTIKFSPKDGAKEGIGYMADVSVSAGTYILPNCSYGAPAGYVFSKWMIGETGYAPGSVITSADVTVQAKWVERNTTWAIDYDDGFDWTGTVTIKAEPNQDNTSGWSNLGDDVVGNLSNMSIRGNGYVGTLMGNIIANVSFSVDGVKCMTEGFDSYIPTIRITFDRGGYVAYTDLDLRDKGYYSIFFVDRGVETERMYEENTLLTRSLCEPPTGANFNGWYLDSKFVNRYDYNLIVTEEMNGTHFYARYTYTVTLDNMNGTSYTIFVAQEDEGATLGKDDFPEPEYPGYEFKGWFKDRSLVYEWAYQSDRVTEDITLYAKWTGKQVRVNFWYEIDGVMYLFGGVDEHGDTIAIPAEDGLYDFSKAYMMNISRGIYPTVQFGSTFDTVDPWHPIEDKTVSILEYAEKSINFSGVFVRWTVASTIDPHKTISIYNDTIVDTKIVQLISDNVIEDYDGLWNYYLAHNDDTIYKRKAYPAGPDMLEINLLAETTKVAIEVVMTVDDADKEFESSINIDDPKSFLVYPNGPNEKDPVPDIEGAYYGEYGQIFYEGQKIEGKVLFYYNEARDVRYYKDTENKCWICVSEEYAGEGDEVSHPDHAVSDTIGYWPDRPKQGWGPNPVTRVDDYGNMIANGYLKSIAYKQDGEGNWHKYLVEWYTGSSPGRVQYYYPEIIGSDTWQYGNRVTTNSTTETGFYLKDASGNYYEVTNTSSNKAISDLTITKLQKGDYYEFVYKLNTAVRNGYTLIGWHNEYISINNSLNPSPDLERRLLIKPDKVNDTLIVGSAILVSTDKDGNRVQTPLMISDYTVDGGDADVNGDIKLVGANTKTKETEFYVKIDKEMDTDPEPVLLAIGKTVNLTDGTSTTKKLKGWQVKDRMLPTAQYTVQESDADANGYITVKAIWKDIYTINFNNNGHGGSISSVTGIEGEIISVPNLVEKGQKFNYWRSLSGEVQLTYTISEKDCPDGSKTITLKAIWNDEKASNKTITLVSEYGTQPQKGDYHEDTDSYDLPNLEVYNNKYKHVGWKVLTGSNPRSFNYYTYVYNPNDVDDYNEIILEAVWIKVYAVQVGDGLIKHYTEGETVELSYNSYNYWKVYRYYYEKGGSISPGEGQFSMTYTAQWEQIDYNVHLDQPYNGIVDAYLGARTDDGQDTYIDDWSETFIYGDRIILSYTPNNSGIEFVKWIVTGKHYITSYTDPHATLVVQGDCSISVDESTGNVIELLISFDDGLIRSAVDKEYTKVYMHDKVTGEYYKAQLMDPLNGREHFNVKVPYSDHYEVCIRYGQSEDGRLLTGYAEPDEYHLVGNVAVQRGGTNSFLFEIISTRFVTDINQTEPAPSRSVTDMSGNIIQDLNATFKNSTVNDTNLTVGLGDEEGKAYIASDSNALIYRTVGGKPVMLAKVTKYIGISLGDLKRIEANGKNINSSTGGTPAVIVTFGGNIKYSTYEGYPWYSKDDNVNKSNFMVAEDVNVFRGYVSNTNFQQPIYLDWTRTDSPADVLVDIDDIISGKSLAVTICRDSMDPLVLNYKLENNEEIHEMEVFDEYEPTITNSSGAVFKIIDGDIPGKKMLRIKMTGDSAAVTITYVKKSYPYDLMTTVPGQDPITYPEDPHGTVNIGNVKELPTQMTQGGTTSDIARWIVVPYKGSYIYVDRQDDKLQYTPSLNDFDGERAIVLSADWGEGSNNMYTVILVTKYGVVPEQSAIQYLAANTNIDLPIASALGVTDKTLTGWRPLVSLSDNTFAFTESNKTPSSSYTVASEDASSGIIFLEAVWSGDTEFKDLYRVVYYTRHGNVPVTTYAFEGTTIALPTASDLSVDDKILNGWKAWKDTSNAAPGTTYTVSGNDADSGTIILQAFWQGDAAVSSQYCIVYTSNYGNAHKVQFADQNDIIRMIPIGAPNKSFNGWQLWNSNTMAALATMEVTKDISSDPKDARVSMIPLTSLVKFTYVTTIGQFEDGSTRFTYTTQSNRTVAQYWATDIQQIVKDFLIEYGDPNGKYYCTGFSDGVITIPNDLDYVITGSEYVFVAQWIIKDNNKFEYSHDSGSTVTAVKGAVTTDTIPSDTVVELRNETEISLFIKPESGYTIDIDLTRGELGFKLIESFVFGEDGTRYMLKDEVLYRYVDNEWVPVDPGEHIVYHFRDSFNNVFDQNDTEKVYRYENGAWKEYALESIAGKDGAFIQKYVSESTNRIYKMTRTGIFYYGDRLSYKAETSETAGYSYDIYRYNGGDKGERIYRITNSDILVNSSTGKPANDLLYSDLRCDNILTVAKIKESAGSYIYGISYTLSPTSILGFFKEGFTYDGSTLLRANGDSTSLLGPYVHKDKTGSLSQDSTVAYLFDDQNNCYQYSVCYDSTHAMWILYSIYDVYGCEYDCIKDDSSYYQGSAYYDGMDVKYRDNYGTYWLKDQYGEFQMDSQTVYSYDLAENKEIKYHVDKNGSFYVYLNDHEYSPTPCPVPPDQYYFKDEYENHFVGNGLVLGKIPAFWIDDGVNFYQYNVQYIDENDVVKQMYRADDLEKNVVYGMTKDGRMLFKEDGIWVNTTAVAYLDSGKTEPYLSDYSMIVVNPKYNVDNVYEEDNVTYHQDTFGNVYWDWLGSPVELTGGRGYTWTFLLEDDLNLKIYTKKVSYTVNFIVNGVRVASSDINKISTIDTSLSDYYGEDIPKYKVVAFDGYLGDNTIIWYTDPNYTTPYDVTGDNKYIEPGAGIPSQFSERKYQFYANENISLYAHMGQYVVYVHDYEDNENNTTKYELPADANNYVELPSEDRFKLAGHIFLGWALEDQYGVREFIYAPGEKVLGTKLVSGSTENKVDLYPYYVRDASLTKYYDGQSYVYRIDNDLIDQKDPFEENIITVKYSDTPISSISEGTTDLQSFKHAVYSTIYYCIEIKTPLGRSPSVDTYGNTLMSNIVSGSSTVEIMKVDAYVVAPAVQVKEGGASDITATVDDITTINLADGDYELHWATIDGQGNRVQSANDNPITQTGPGTTYTYAWIEFTEREEEFADGDYNIIYIDGALVIYPDDSSKDENVNRS